MILWIRDDDLVIITVTLHGGTSRAFSLYLFCCSLYANLNKFASDMCSVESDTELFIDLVRLPLGLLCNVTLIITNIKKANAHWFFLWAS